jgi:ABC-type Fe3+/spermidine/putrescine transport system ATPase subunit
LGQRCTASVRPEKIRVARRADSPAARPDEVCVEGVVAEAVYAGAATRIVVDAGPDLTLAALVLNVEGGSGLSRGDAVTLTWDRPAVTRLDPDPPTKEPQ